MTVALSTNNDGRMVNEKALFSRVNTAPFAGVIRENIANE